MVILVISEAIADFFIARKHYLSPTFPEGDQMVVDTEKVLPPNGLPRLPG